MEKSKAIEAIRFVRQAENKHYEKGNFCREHNMTLDAIKHNEIKNELRRIANNLQTIFETGYVSHNEQKLH